MVDELLRRDSSTLEVIHLSSFDNHAAVPFKRLSTEEIAVLVKEAIPGQQNNSTGVKKRNNFVVSWLSYNYDNYNSNWSRKWYYEATQSTPEEADSVANKFNLFAAANEGWKYCFDVVTEADPNLVPSKAMMNVGEMGTAIHGEVYFNTYGGIDGQCNSFYDCAINECN